eukprot:c3894_g1_i2.p1 GENE.c3894_g1_i2~~c3894_g1_i2.p1  ORF type:complete len:937 (-),score=281.23 c3894_g1_i2:27-2807(-)
MSLQWRRFQFFETSEVKEEGSASTPIQLSPKYDLACCTSGHGTMVFGDNEGNIHLLGRDLKPASFKAFEVKVDRVFQLTSQNILLAVGEDKLANQQHKLIQLKMWFLDKEDKNGGPLLVRIQKIFPSKNIEESPVTALAAVDDMTHVAVGLENGSVILYRGDLMRDRIQNRHSVLVADSKAKVTALYFRGSGKQTMLYVVTTKEAYYYFTAAKIETLVSLKDGNLTCSTLNGDQDLVLGYQEAIFFTLGDDNGPCYGIDGVKHCLAWFRGYLVLVSTDPTASAPVHRLQVYDLKNRFIAFSDTFPEIKCLLCEFGSIFAVTGDRKVIQLKEKDTQTKLDMLFKKNLFVIAINLASSNDFDESLVIDIYRKFGDHLYAKGDYDSAVDQYVKTIGRLEPSYIIRKFLDVQRTQNLTQYLQALHEKHLASSDHTTLLLNCYTKLKDSAHLDAFIKDPSLHFDIDTAINVLRQAEFYDHALSLALRHQHHAHYLTIQIDDRKAYGSALEYLWTLPFEQCREHIITYGKVLVTNLPEQATELMKELCTRYTPRKRAETGKSETLVPQQAAASGESALSSAFSQLMRMGTNQTPESSTPTPASAAAAPEVVVPTQRADPEDFIYVFVTQPSWLMVFLEYVISRNPEQATELVNNTLLELYLSDSASDVAIRQEKRIKALKLLQSSKAFTLNHALLLCQLHQFPEGTLLLNERLNLHAEVLNVHIRAHDHRNIVETCKRFGKPELWMMALQYFATTSTDCNSMIKEVLEHIDRQDLLPPLKVIEILSQNPSISLDIVKDFVLKRLEQDQKVMLEDEKKIASFREETQHMRQEIRELRSTAKIFQNQKCSDCTNPLQAPSTHFLCGHSFHQRCIPDEKECPKCAHTNSKTEALKSEMQRNATNHELFLQRLKVGGFATVTEYFGHGIFQTAPGE